MMEDRDITKTDVEFYLLNREFNELTSEEHAIVKAYVDSEQEFNEMKAVMMGAGDFFKEEKELEPNPAIKAALLKEFDKQQPAGAYWLNGIFVSLFPKEKKLYQKPGMQLIGLAASVLLVVTIVFNGNGDLNGPTLAQTKDVKTEKETIEEVKELEEKDIDVENNFMEDELEAPIDVLDKEVELDVLNEVEREEISEVVANNVTGSTFAFDASPVEDEVYNYSFSDTDQEIDNRGIGNSNDDLKDSFKKESSKNKESTTRADDNLVISATTIATSDVVEEVVENEADYFIDDATTVATGGVMAPGVKGNAVDLPVNSRTLAEDADLIGILYTAM